MAEAPHTTARASSDLALVAARDLTVAVSRLRRRLHELRGEDGLTPSQTSVLSRLEKDGPATASELAVAERVRPQSMTATVAVLVERGLVRREPDPDDGRRQCLALTDHAHAWITDTRRVRNEWLAATLQQELTTEELSTVVQAIALIERAML
ncbi:MarR family transcriptional regulator [Dactylosporangium fulvum]|uniref:MarR family transcriptional regulator n=1 Tax=Dactylosporangium fulvum TaxID=53359 RepID=A0ABY5VT83_9ACTN|nr:MarR family transcriptional regulator [Dactylosporangium fulvum]UWP79693.1 MarR family transcriptional regulator [Dactylosporangium fulvum]